MLVLSRHVNEKIIIGGQITIAVVEIRGDKVRLGITADPSVRIDREEIHAQRIADAWTTREEFERSEP